MTRLLIPLAILVALTGDLLLDELSSVLTCRDYPTAGIECPAGYAWVMRGREGEWRFSCECEEKP